MNKLSAKQDSSIDPFDGNLAADVGQYPRGRYNCQPTFELDDAPIIAGYAALTAQLLGLADKGRVLVLDGFNGVDFDSLRIALARELEEQGHPANWIDISACLRSESAVLAEIEPFLGGDDPLFGRHMPLGLDLFFDPQLLAKLRVKVSQLRGAAAGVLTIVYGCGAALVELYDLLWYADIPKDVLQVSARNNAITNLGGGAHQSFSRFYKRSYFVDWPALNRHKRALLPQLDMFIDMQDPACPAALSGDRFRAGLHQLSESPFRARPWFSPGPWGGKFMQGHMGLDADQPNFAWSFELIAPENGIVFENAGKRLEFSFDCLMYQENVRMLGDAAARQFRHEWPIRFDYLDTVEGGSLSTQVHPRPEFMRANFGETYTQDETYYIAAAQPGSRVNIGLTEDCDPGEFRNALTESAKTGKAIDISRFVHSEPSKRHDLFLIPNGTVHCSGAGNLVLEISATPYIFTFKIYDYVRQDLEGNLRPLNIARAWENIYFHRRPKWVRERLIAKPQLLRSGEGWQEYLLSDLPGSFFDVYRIEFEQEVTLETDGAGLTVNLVEGEWIEVFAGNGRRYILNYLETMVIPAATGNFTLVNRGRRPCKLVQARVRPGIGRGIPLNSPGLNNDPESTNPI